MSSPNHVDTMPIFRHSDERGVLQEVFRAEWFASFVPQQVNISFNKQDVLRGLHYHRKQTDVWFPIQGRFQCAFRDEFNTTPTNQILFLDAMKPVAVRIPPFIVHGFLSLDADSILGYAVDQPYDPEDEHTLPWNAFGIPWRVANPILSERDNK